jgi:hypothetical protein
VGRAPADGRSARPPFGCPRAPVHFGRHRLPSCCAVVRDSRAGRVLASSRLKTPSPDSIPPFGLRRSGLGDRCGEHGSHELGTVRAVGLVTHMTPPAPCLAQPSSTVREHGLRPRVGRTHSLAPSDSRHDQACNASGAWREGEQRGAASLPCLPSTVLPSTIALEATWWHRASPCIAAWTRIAVWTRSAVSTRGGGGGQGRLVASQAFAFQAPRAGSENRPRSCVRQASSACAFP